jgi:hypothetical protein
MGGGIVLNLIYDKMNGQIILNPSEMSVFHFQDSNLAAFMLLACM